MHTVFSWKAAEIFGLQNDGQGYLHALHIVQFLANHFDPVPIFFTRSNMKYFYALELKQILDSLRYLLSCITI